MSRETWYVVYDSDSLATTLRSLTGVQQILESHPNAQVKSFSSVEGASQWLNGRQSTSAQRLTTINDTRPSKSGQDSPRSTRIRTCAPYSVPGSSSQSPIKIVDRTVIARALRKARQSSENPQIPGAFPLESGDLSDATESEYDSDDIREEDVDMRDTDIFASLEDEQEDHTRPEVEGDVFAATEMENELREIASDISSNYSYPSEGLPLEDELLYEDPSSSTPPTSSQPGSSQPSLGVDNPCSERDDTDSAPVSVSVVQPPTEIVLSQEQQHVLNRVRAGASVFFTGSAGTGKSVLLREVIKALGGPSQRVVVTASTGIAAVNIGGQTLHSFAGVGLGNQARETLIARAWKSRGVPTRWRETQILIIDEISMVDARWFDDLEAIARSVRECDEPFGGIQLVVCGDFFQLPPVPDVDQSEMGIPARFAFQAYSWERAVPNMITLTQVFRQKEPKLIKMLNDMRLGTISPGSEALFKGLSRPLVCSDGIVPTEIFPLRRKVEESNQQHLARLSGRHFTFTGKDKYLHDIHGVKISPTRGKAMLDRIVAPTLQLKIGAQVMCIRNLPLARLVNGSVGKVVDFSMPFQVRPPKPEEIVRGETSAPDGSCEPDKKHESRDTRTGNLAAPTTQPTTCVISDLEPKDPKEPRENAEYYAYEGAKWPVVQFTNGVRALMGPLKFTSERADGEVQASREQVPLILAWALTVHKSQGQTLDRVKVDLNGTFEKGQAYVALSRCTSLEGLEVRNFTSAAVVAHPRVIAWSRTLASYDSGSVNSYENRPNRSESQPRQQDRGEKQGSPSAMHPLQSLELDSSDEEIAIQMYHQA